MPERISPRSSASSTERSRIILGELVQLRPARPQDIGAIGAIYAHHVLKGLASFEEEPPSETELRRRYDEVTGRGLPYLVAEFGGLVAGYAYCTLYRSRSAYRHSLEDSVYVRPDAQGRGIGKTLLGALIRRCEALGYRQMIAIIGDSANAASIGLHESEGFLRAGTLRSVGFKLGRWVDSVIMQRPLGAGDGSPPLP
jgi:L-amino acid N-acyltransferase YncA